MPIPELLHGLLPMGVHPATVEEVVTRFGSGNPRRVALGESFTQFVEFLRTFGLFTYLFVDGSFTTDKDLPGDVDVVAHIPMAKMRNNLAVHPIAAELEHDALKARFEVDFHPEISEAGHTMMVKFFQTMRARDVIARKVAANYVRGILKVSL